ncbi:MAG: hypothetical protein ACD_42C00528G0003 [uncultured bacterium]|nr:MAG: hypothetical protein ACD_42C00528G0003 [uncultured bacterium]
MLTSDDQPVHAQINYGTDSASVSGLQAGYSYKAIVTATDKNGAGSQQSQPSQPAYFTTTFFTAPTNVAITPTQTSAAITWTPSQDTYPNATIMYAATVSLTPGGDPAVPVVSSTSPSATVNGLTSSTQYYATIKATDTVNNLVASASPVPFTTTAAASLSQPQLSVVEHNSELGTVSWPHVTATGFNPGQLGTGNYTVSITGAPAVITNYSCDGSGCTVTFSRRSTQGDTVTVTAHAGDVTSLPASILVR